MSPPAYPHPPPIDAWGAQPAGDPPAPPPGTNGWALASLLLGIAAPCGGGLLSVIFGFVALVQVRDSGQRGKGLAIGGLAATGGWLLAFAIGLAIAISTAERDPSGDVVEGGRISLDSLAPGDCVNDLEDEGLQSSLPAVACAEPHEGEVYALFDVTMDGGWPGEDAISAEADSGCLDRLGSYSPDAQDDDTVTLYYVYPTRSSWQDGDREVICIVYFLDGPRTGSLAG